MGIRLSLTKNLESGNFFCLLSMDHNFFLLRIRDKQCFKFVNFRSIPTNNELCILRMVILKAAVAKAGWEN